MAYKKENGLKLYLECEIRDKNGKLLSKYKKESESLLKNFMVILQAMFNTSVIKAGPIGNQNTVYTVTVKDTSGASKSVGVGVVFYNYVGSTNYWILLPLTINAPQNDDTYGIQVGSSPSSVSRDDYMLGGKILSGSGNAQLVYGAMTVEIPDGIPPDTVFRAIRTFTNNTSDNITVYEIGLVIANQVASYQTTLPTPIYVLIARDVLTSPQTIPPGATLTVRYIFKVTA
jgi:hypothetical protein